MPLYNPVPLATYTNVKDAAYRAKGDGSTDDTSAIQAAINACSSGGTVFFPTGTYMISSSLTFPNDGIHLLGAGEEATILMKSANCDLIDLSGTATGDSTHRKYCSVKNMKLHGNNKTGKLLRVYYSSLHLFDSIHFYGNNDMAIESAEFWDSYFSNCFWDFCSDQAGTNPAVYLKNSAAASGFGNSADSTNMIWFINCHWESFYAGALWVDALNGSTDNPNGIFVINSKMESTVIMGPFLKFGSLCRIIFVENLYMSADSFNSGFSTPVDAISFAGAGSLKNIQVANGGSCLSSCINFNPADISEIQNLKHSGASTSVATINFTGGNGTIVHMGGIEGNGTVYANNTGNANIYDFDSNILKVHNPSFATPYTPDPLNNGNVVILSPVTSNFTINAPVMKWPGAELTFILTSNGTGSFTITWNSAFKATQNTLPNMPGANATIVVKFVCNGTNWYRAS